MSLMLETVPCLSDNYAYLLHDPVTGGTAVVDVPDADAVQAALAHHGWGLTDILITHHHTDHIGGVPALKAATGARVWGAGQDAARLPPLDATLTPPSTVTILGEEVTVLPADGHTVGHIAYHFPQIGALFCGDSLMVMGCGRLFEGDAPTMWATLMRLSALPDGTRVCSGHEYTAANIRFALSVDPDNAALRARARDTAAARDAGQPTVPAPLSLERATNPFLRAGTVEMRAAAGLPDAPESEVFAQLRHMKDSF